MIREADGIISLTIVDLERSDQGHLLKSRVSVRDSAIVTIKPKLEIMGRGSDGIISLTFGDLERSDRGHLLKFKAGFPSEIALWLHNFSSGFRYPIPSNLHTLHTSRVVMRHGVLQHVLSHRITPYHVTLQRLASLAVACHVTSRHVTSCFLLSGRVTSRSYRLRRRQVASCDIMSHHVESRHVASWCIGQVKVMTRYLMVIHKYVIFRQR